MQIFNHRLNGTKQYTRARRFTLESTDSSGMAIKLFSESRNLNGEFLGSVTMTDREALQLAAEILGVLLRRD